MAVGIGVGVLLLVIIIVIVACKRRQRTPSSGAIGVSSTALEVAEKSISLRGQVGVTPFGSVFKALLTVLMLACASACFLLDLVFLLCRRRGLLHAGSQLK